MTSRTGRDGGDARSFWLIAVGFFVLQVGVNAPTALYPDYAAAFHLDHATTSWLYAAYTVVLPVCLVVFGPLTDRFGVRVIGIAGALVATAALVVLTTADSGAAVIAARVLQGVAVGAFTAAAGPALYLYGAGLYRRSVSDVTTTVAPTAGSAAGPVTCALLALWLADPLHDPFIVLGMVMLVVAVLLIGDAVRIGRSRAVAPDVVGVVAAEPQPVASARDESDHEHDASRRRLVIMFVAGTVVSYLGWATAGTYQVVLPLWMRDHDVTAPQLLAIAPAMIFVVSPIVQLTLTRLDGVTLRAVCALAHLAAALCLVVGVELGAIAAVLASAIFIGIGHGTGFLGGVRAVNSLIARYAPGRHGAIMALFYSINYLALGLPAVGVGALADALSLSVALNLFALAVAMTAAGCLTQAVRERSRVRRFQVSDRV